MVAEKDFYCKMEGFEEAWQRIVPLLTPVGIFGSVCKRLIPKVVIIEKRQHFCWQKFSSCHISCLTHT